MKTFYFKRHLLIIVTAMLCFKAFAADVTGTINASSLADNAELKLTGATTLNMDIAKTLKSIKGDYALVIQGANTLEVINTNGHAISVKSLSSLAFLRILSSKDGLNVTQDITLNNGIFVDAGGDGVYSKEGSINLKGTVTANAGRHVIWARGGDVAITGNLKATSTASKESCIKAGIANNSGWYVGNITLTGGPFEITSVDDGLYTPAGGISISGDATITSANGAAIYAGVVENYGSGNVLLDGTINVTGKTYGACAVGNLLLVIGGSITSKGMLYAYQNVILNGNVEVESSSHAIWARGGDVAITGNLKATSTASKESCIKAGIASGSELGVGNITLTGGTYNITSIDDGLYTPAGCISISGDATITSDNGAAIYAGVVENYGSGDVFLIGTFNVTGKTYGVCAVGNLRLVNGGSITSKGMLYAYQNVILNGNVDVESSSHAIWARGGDVAITGNLKATSTASKESCIKAGIASGSELGVGNITLTEGTYNIISIDDGLYTPAGCISISGDATITSANGAAIYAGVVESYGSGNVLLDGTINVTGKTYGVCAVGDVSVNGGLLVSYGEKYALYSYNKTIKTQFPLTVTIPTGGKVSGNTIVNSDNTTATYVQIDKPALSGLVELDTPNPVNGSWVRYTLSGDVQEVANNGVTLNAQWQRSDDGVSNWTNVSGDKDSNGKDVYIVSPADINKFIRVKLTADGYDGMLYSTPREVKKSKCYVDVVAPTLEISSGQVRVSNAKSYQEYIIMAQRKTLAQLSASDWAQAKTPDNTGILLLGGTTNVVNYVYTRVKETETALVGTDVATANIYLGETVYTQAIELATPQRKNSGSVTRPYLDLPQDDLGYYYANVGDIIKIEAKPIPEGATNFNGIFYDKWINNSNGGAFYTDRSCTQSLQSGTYYKTVYFKCKAQQNVCEISAEFTKGYNDIARDAFTMVVGDADGNNILTSVTDKVTIGKGEKLEGITSAAIRPALAKFNNNMDVELITSSSTGTSAPIVSFNYGTQTYEVDASRGATRGTYVFNVRQNHRDLYGTITVEVVSPAVESIRLMPEEVTLDRGKSLQMSVQLFPSNADPESIRWSVQKSGIATISDDGLLTVMDNAIRGVTTNVFVVVDEKYMKVCKLTVPKLYPDLSFSENNFEINVGETFTAPTLNNPDNLPVTYTSSDESVIAVDGASGAITIKGYGYATVTASFAGNDDYEAGQTGYSIIINRLANDLAFSKTSATGDVSQPFTAPTLVNPHGLAVTYFTDDPSVAEVDETTGAVTLVEDGETIISAYFAGNATYEAGWVEYVLTVTGSSTGISDVHTEATAHDNEGWFTINGQKLSERPTVRGIYIHRGRKIVIR